MFDGEVLGWHDKPVGEIDRLADLRERYLGEAPAGAPTG